jgi:hypothetical protein
MIILSIPSGRYKHTISRHGKRKDDGGDGVKWSCSCSRKSRCPFLHLLLRGKIPAQDTTNERAAAYRFFTTFQRGTVVYIVPKKRKS